MIIHIVKSEEQKDDQHWEMVWDCEFHWCRLNNANKLHYIYVMNMETYRFNDEHRCYVALTYHFNLNKW